MVNRLLINNNLNFEATNKKKPIKNNAFQKLNQDCISFSADITDNKKEIKSRIRDFSKLMDGKDIPKEVLKVLNNTEIPFSKPIETSKPLISNTLQKNIARIIEFTLPEKLSNKIINKITDKPNADFDTYAIRLNKLKILDKSESIFRGNGEIYFLSLVCDGKNEPAVLKIEKFKDIKDGDDLFDKGLQKPFTLFLSEKGEIPRLLDFRLLVMEEDRLESQSATDMMETLTKDKEYKDIMDAISALIKQSAPPVAIFSIIDSALGVIKKVVKCNEDDQLLYFAARFTKDFDNLGIGTYDQKCEKVELGYDIVAK